MEFKQVQVSRMQPTIILHGGAGTITRDRYESKFIGLKNAIRVGYQTLLETDNSLDAVEQAIIILENDPAFNTGYGSVQTITGEIEMDAIIMNGSNYQSGAVGAVRHIANPISLARLVMEKTKHVFIVGTSAEDFAVSQGIKLVPTDDLIVKSTSARLEQTFKDHEIDGGTGTVGAVAINSKGQIAAATSTGGIRNKMNGRVGDTPIIGGGTLAEDDICGLSATGTGEPIMRYRVTSRVAHLIEKGIEPNEAILTVLNAMTAKIPEGNGGVIAITKDGTIGFEWNSSIMCWIYARLGEDKLHYGIEKGDDFVEPLVLTE